MLKRFVGASILGLVGSALAMLVGCNSPIGDVGMATCQATCSDSVSLVADVPVNEREIRDVRLRICKNEDCSIGRPLVDRPDQYGFVDCGLSGALAESRCNVFSLANVSPPDAETHRLSISLDGPKDLVDGDVYRVVVERVSDGTVLFDQARPTDYKRVKFCDDRQCQQASIDMTKTR